MSLHFALDTGAALSTSPPTQGPARSQLRDTLSLLRLPFSLLLLPVFLLAVSQAPAVAVPQGVAVALILHLLVYPSSNGYNSWVDRDTGPIGGLEAPPPPPRLLWWTALVMDALALALSLAVEPWFGLGVGVYVLASRAYSWEGIRLKKYPVLGFLTVFVFQGCFTYVNTLLGAVPRPHWPALLEPRHLALALAAGCLIGGVYPLTQVYQHQEDAAHGDRSLSMLLGIRGTFLFAALLFTLGGVLLSFGLPWRAFGAFVLLLSPVTFTLLDWARRVWRDPAEANFKRTMRLNVVAALCMNLCFGGLCVARWAL